MVSGTFLARNLGSNYLGTLSNPSDEDFDPISGTGTSVKNLVKGTLDYLKEKKIKVKKVTVISMWAPKDPRKDYGHPGTLIELKSRAPSKTEIRNAVRKRAIVVSHYGHYDFQPNPARLGSKAKNSPYLLRTGGHYVAPVGYGKNQYGKNDAEMFIFNDPAGSYQDKQAQVYKKWYRQPKGVFQNLPLLNDRDGDSIRHPSYNYPPKPGFEMLGNLSQTYVRDAALKDPKRDDRFEVMESLIIIEV